MVSFTLWLFTTGETPSGTTEWAAGWAAESVWTFCRREESLDPAGNRNISTDDHPVAQRLYRLSHSGSCSYICAQSPPPPMAQQPLVGQGLLIIEAFRDSYLITHDSHRDRNPCLRRESNPQSQQASGRRRMP